MWRRVTPKYLLWALAGVVAAGLVLFLLWWGPWVFTLHPSSDLTDAEELKAENNVRTTLVQTVAGLAVAAGAVVTYRTFRQNQLDQVNRHDREERTYKLNESQQVTDTYTKAVEQLGHDQAPVRLGAMYALERLAQDNPPRRQTIVDVLCAYLRMPFTS
jgi:glycerol uptake facilitator-like aquaporin